MSKNKNRKIAGRVPASNPSWDEGDSTWEGGTGTWDDCNGSALWPEIPEASGTAKRDRCQGDIDSAYKGACDVLLTSDKGDISSNSNAIYALTGVRVFHSRQEWDAFVGYVRDAA